MGGWANECFACFPQLVNIHHMKKNGSSMIVHQQHMLTIKHLIFLVQYLPSLVANDLLIYSSRSLSLKFSAGGSLLTGSH